MRLHKVFLFLLFASLLLIVGCSPVSKTALTKKFHSLEASLQDHAGFIVYDPSLKKELYEYQASQYFTPASNTKIFTLYTSLVLLGDSVPALHYKVSGDSLLFRGVGDPSVFYPNVFSTNNVWKFLKQHAGKLYLIQDNFHTTAIGPGWAWDDLPYTFSVERSAFPLYGNFLQASYTNNKMRTMPAYFSFNIVVKDSAAVTRMERDLGSNQLYFFPGVTREENNWDVPFKTSAALTASLLSDTLKRNVTLLSHSKSFKAYKTLYNTPADSLYKVMMQESDNFIAEQLLLVCSGVLSDSLKPEIAINYMKKNHLADLQDVPVWVDGSGLSRYNLFTPRSIVALWEKIYKNVPRERLFNLVAVGGESGTLKNYYKNTPPYIYGKTGTLSNNHSLSGFLVTQSGRTLIFCFMNNNYPASVKTARVEMEKILYQLYQHY